ncbi:hypothetical protein [Oceanospirillum sp.]|uniref:hypothetical protein n=1 Tax=Oceanospirillum sp. TaxID=2021254 RepID=UPI003A93B11B
MWIVILVTLLIGALGEVCLGRSSRQYWKEHLREQSKVFLKISTWLTMTSIIGLIVVQFYYQGILLGLSSFLQLVAGAFLMQKALEKTAISVGLRLNLALIAGPVCLTLLMLVIDVYP